MSAVNILLEAVYILDTGVILGMGMTSASFLPEERFYSRVDERWNGASRCC